MYNIIDSGVLQKIIDSLNPTCAHCSSQEGVSVRTSSPYGLANKLTLECNACDAVIFDEFTSPQVPDGNARDINNRFVLACKSSGIGYEQSAAFLANLNMPPPISDTAFNKKLENLNSACEAALEEHMNFVRGIVRNSYIEEGLVPENSEFIDIAVSYDGTWHKRGHTSHSGIGVAIDILTGYVVDFEVMSNFCLTC